MLEPLVASESRAAQRNAMLIAMLAGAGSMQASVLKAYSGMPERHPNESLARNCLRKYCDEAMVSEFVSMLRNPASFNRALDFLMTVTGMWDLCPDDARSARARIETAERFEKWLESKRGSLKWDAKERRFLR
jgi:hypothetical protein